MTDIRSPESLALQKKFEFQYMSLGRCQMDCLRYINYNGFKYGFQNLWAGANVAEHITEMKALYKILPVKPEWLTMDQVKEYERQMLEIEKKNK